MQITLVTRVTFRCSQCEIKRLAGDPTLQYLIRLTEGHIDYMSRMPDNVLEAIICDLELEDLVKLAATCKRFKKLCNSNTVWEKIFRREVETPVTPELEALAEKEGWKRLFYANKLQIQVVSLGAGFDTLFWNLKDEFVNPTSYIEEDFSAVTSRKIQHIRRSEKLLFKITSDECVLVYIEKSNTDAILKWVIDNYPTTFFVNYAQVNVADKFGEVMLDNFRSRDCMLHVEYCQSLESQKQRLLTHGFEGADAMEMRHVLSSLPQDDIHRIQHIEFLDERELLDQLMSHYCYYWAFKDLNNIGLAQINI